MMHYRVLLIPICGASILASLAVAQTAPGDAVSSLQGHYSFFLHGQESSLRGGVQLVALAGSILTDGTGKITSGVLDKNSASGLIQTQSVSGTYQLDSTGKGSISLVTPQGNYGFTFYALNLTQGTYIRAAIVAYSGSVLEVTGEFGPSSSIGDNTTTFGTTFGFTEAGEVGVGTNLFLESGTLNFVPAANLPAGTLGGTVTENGVRISDGMTK